MEFLGRKPLVSHISFYINQVDSVATFESAPNCCDSYERVQFYCALPQILGPDASQNVDRLSMLYMLIHFICFMLHSIPSIL